MNKTLNEQDKTINEIVCGCMRNCTQIKYKQMLISLQLQKHILYPPPPTHTHTQEKV